MSDEPNVPPGVDDPDPATEAALASPSAGPARAARRRAKQAALPVPTVIGDATLYAGDALDLLPRFPEAAFDAVITDPPYSSGGMFRGDRVNQTTDEKYTVHQHQGKRPDFSGDNMDGRSWANWCRVWLAHCRRVTREGGYLVVFTDWRQLPALTDAVQHAGWVWRGVLAWDKTEAAKGPHTGYFAYQCEFLVWATNGPCLPKPNLSEGGDGRLQGCFRQAVRQSDKHHQTGKPTEVMRWLVRCCPHGGTVLDPFAGSGTTLVAAVQTGRKAVGCEVNADYQPVVDRRVREAQGECDLFAPTEAADAET